MAQKKIPQKSPTIHFERGEFDHFVRALEGIQSRASNLLCIAEVIEARATKEFRQSMRIIKRGGAHE
jgi:hypothetical protein